MTQPLIVSRLRAKQAEVEAQIASDDGPHRRDVATFPSRRRAALEASPEPPWTRRLAHHIVAAEGWGVEDGRLRPTVAHEVGPMLVARFEKRGVAKGGAWGRAPVWGANSRDAER